MAADICDCRLDDNNSWVFYSCFIVQRQKFNYPKCQVIRDKNSFGVQKHISSRSQTEGAFSQETCAQQNALSQDSQSNLKWVFSVSMLNMLAETPRDQFDETIERLLVFSVGLEAVQTGFSPYVQSR